MIVVGVFQLEVNRFYSILFSCIATGTARQGLLEQAPETIACLLEELHRRMSAWLHAQST